MVPLRNTATGVTTKLCMDAVSVADRQSRAERYLARVGPAVQGSNGDAHTYGACKVGLKFDLTEAEFWPVLSRWNGTCQPPWDDRDLERKLSTTYRKSHVERGSAIKAQRGQHDPTPPKRRREPSYPPQAEVLAFWERLAFASEVPEVSTWLASRGLTVSKLGAHPALCVRALNSKPGIEPWPSWACYGQRQDRSPRPWNESGFQALLPLFDARGELRSIKARQIRAGQPGAKSVPASGYDVERLMMMNLPAILMLHHEAWQDQAERELRIVEGEPDFWTTVQRVQESGRPHRGVIGIFAGSISIDLLRRLAPGTVLMYDGHQDQAGDDYLAGMLRLIASTGLGSVLHGKGITIKRAVRS
jgi:hypothetical protein